jgi:hypothetical protein
MWRENGAAMKLVLSRRISVINHGGIGSSDVARASASAYERRQWRIVSKRKALLYRRGGGVMAPWRQRGCAAARHGGIRAPAIMAAYEIKRRRRGGNKSKSVLASAHVGISSGVGRRLKA